MHIVYFTGAHCLKNLMSIQQEFNNQYNPVETSTPAESNDRLEQYATKLQSGELSNIYPVGELPEKVEVQDVTLRSREEDIKEQLDM